MTPSRRQLFRLLLLVLALAGAMTACVFLMVRGQWTEFGRFVMGLPGNWRNPGYRRAYVSHWIVPLAMAYIVVLCGSIFWGLRRLRRGAG